MVSDMTSPPAADATGRRALRLAVTATVVMTLAACTSTDARTAAPSGPAPTTVAAPTSSSETPTPLTSSTTVSAAASTTPPLAKATAVSSSPAASTAAPAVPAGTGPVIVIDPGHSPTIDSIDPASGLNDSDYENEPEMRDVFSVALLVKAQLELAGYRVVMTKSTATTRISLGQRAAVANNAGAALAISIHDQAGASGGIGFNQGNNIVYYQAVGDYRETPKGAKVTFTDSALAATSQRYGAVFQRQRAAAEGHTVHLQGNTGYDLGTRGLAPGDIWIVQLLSKVPWVYNEAGGNSAGQVGLSAADKQKYASGLVAGVEQCVPVTG